MSSACAGLLKLIDNRCDELACSFCGIYGVLKANCARACRKAELTAVLGPLRSEGSMSRYILQIVSLTSLVSLADGRVKISMDGMLDRFVSYIFNYAAIHLLSSLSSVRARVDGFRAKASELIFGAEDLPGRRRLSSSVYSAGYEDSVHELTAEESALDIAQEMLRGSDTPQRGDAKDFSIVQRPEAIESGLAATGPEDTPAVIGSLEGALSLSAVLPSAACGADSVDDTAFSDAASLGFSAAFASVDQPPSAVFATNDAKYSDPQFDSDSVDYAVIDARVVNHERMAAFERDVIYIFPKQPEASCKPGLITSETVHETMSSDGPSDAQPLPHRRPDTAVRYSSVTRDRGQSTLDSINEAAGMDVSPLVTPRSKVEAVACVSVDNGNRNRISYSVEFNTPQLAPQTEPAPNRSKSKSRLVSARRKAKEAARIARLTRPKKPKKKQAHQSDDSCAPQSALAVETEGERGDSAASRRHWFGRALWRSSIIVKEEDEAWHSPVRPKASPKKAKRAPGGSKVLNAETDEDARACLSGPAEEGPPLSRQEEEHTEPVHPNIAELLSVCKSLLKALKQSPNNKFYTSFDVRGSRKEFKGCVSMLEQQIAEVRSLCEEAAMRREIVNGRYDYSKQNCPLETFDESFFGADEKIKKEERHITMNRNFALCVGKIDKIISEIQLFLDQFGIAHRRYDMCPSNSSQQYLEKFGTRKGHALLGQLQEVAQFNEAVLQHCAACGPDGAKTSRVEQSSRRLNESQTHLFSASASLLLSKSWKNIMSSPFKSVDNSVSRLSVSAKNIDRNAGGTATYREYAVQQKILPKQTEPLPEEPPKPPLQVDLADATFVPGQYQMYNDISYHIYNHKNKRGLKG